MQTFEKDNKGEEITLVFLCETRTITIPQPKEHNINFYDSLLHVSIYDHSQT